MASAEHHRNVRDLLGAYVLEAVDEAERKDIDDHLQHCVVCRKELAGFQEAVDLLPERPELSDRLWKGIVAEVRGRGDQVGVRLRRYSQLLGCTGA